MRLSSIFRFKLFLIAICLILYTYHNYPEWGVWERIDAWFTVAIGPKTERDVYRLEAEKSGAAAGAVLGKWEASFAVADTQRLSVTLPHREDFRVDSLVDLSAQAIRFTLPAGRVLSTTGKSTAGQLFGELYRVGNNNRKRGRPLASWSKERQAFEYEGEGEEQDLILLIQSQLGTGGSAQITLKTEAALLFPVAGKDDRAIKSFWGDSRDGGRRKHKGNDIFAPKGTPLLAMTDGRITKIGNGGLGGKTVWLFDRARKQSYYYAHLDEQFVRKGDYVNRGDTIGTVGNTGNARTTPPHLHFGVYANGAYDPAPLLKRSDDLPASPRYRLENMEGGLRVPRSGNHYLRISPSRKGAVIRELENGEQLVGISVTGKFYRALTERGEYGYVNFD